MIREAKKLPEGVLLSLGSAVALLSACKRNFPDLPDEVQVAAAHLQAVLGEHVVVDE